jgi:hypothetical protein
MASLVPVLAIEPPTTQPSPWIRMDTTSKPLLVVLGKTNGSVQALYEAAGWSRQTDYHVYVLKL